jgi:hypothetical protein
LKRKSVKGYKTGGGCFSGKIVCGECGGFYEAKCGIQEVNTGGQYGSVTTSLKMIRNARHHIYMRMI